jgi:multiple sugar transport system permease protein
VTGVAHPTRTADRVVEGGTARPAVPGGPPPAGRRPARRGWSVPDRAWPYLLVLPAVLVLVVFRFYPLVLGANFSFTGDGELNGAFVGLDNYAEIFADPVFRAALGNVGLLLLLLPVAVAVPGLLATFLYLRVPGHRVYRSVYFFPVVLSPVIIGAIFNIVLSIDGPVNGLLGLLGLGPVEWLGDPDIAMLSVVGVHVWATFGMALVIFLAGFATLDQSLLDAARVDGANLAQTVRHVVVPGLARTIQFVVVTTMIGMLTAMFGLLYVTTGGGPGSSTYLPELYIWVTQGELNRPALASAASMVLFVLMVVVGAVQIRLLRRATGDGS